MADSTDIALKYLEMARNEILEKVRFVNQTLAAYVLGTSAIASWFYHSIYQHSSSGTLAVTDAEKSSAAIGLALVLSYLALGVIWIIHHNERVVTALAFYQRDELHKDLKDDPPMWERSQALRSGDGPRDSLFTIFAEELIVLVPPLAAALYALSELSRATWPWRLSFFAALVANVLNICIAISMSRNRGRLRKAGENETPPGAVR